MSGETDSKCRVCGEYHEHSKCERPSFVPAPGCAAVESDDLDGGSKAACPECISKLIKPH